MSTHEYRFGQCSKSDLTKTNGQLLYTIHNDIVTNTNRFLISQQVHVVLNKNTTIRVGNNHQSETVPTEIASDRSTT